MAQGFLRHVAEGPGHDAMRAVRAWSRCIGASATHLGERMALTDEQLAVVRHRDGHAVVNAVAGAGKSTTLVEAIAMRVREGVDPRRIRAIMFNKDAQLSMQARVNERVTDGAVKVQTFHSVGYEILRRLQQSGVIEASKLGTDRDLLRMRRKALKEAWGNSPLPPTGDEEFERFVTLVKANTLTPDQIFVKNKFPEQFKLFPQAFAFYELERMRRKKYGFDDMIYLPVMAMRANPELQLPFTNHLDWLYVDEFQDTNPIQFELMRIIAGQRAKVVVVGDVDQAIYGWRGAEPELILHTFAKVFSPCTTYALTRNFRYGHRAALLANHIITNNVERDDKITIASSNNPLTTISIVPEKSVSDSGLVPMAEKLQANGRLMDAMMLVRSFSQSVRYEVELLAANIPFYVYGRVPLVALDEIAAQVAALSLASGHWAIEEPEARAAALMAMFRVPSLYLNAEEQMELAEIIETTIDDVHRLPDAVRRFAKNLPHERNRVVPELIERARVIETLSSGRLQKSTPDVVLGTYDAMTQLTAWLERQTVLGNAGAEMSANVKAFRQVAAKESELIKLVDRLGPMAGKKAAQPPETPHFRITSIHRAKGAEYPIVFVSGWADGAFPLPSSPMEEERRLAYVAVTRAMEHLVLMTPACSALAAVTKHPNADPPSGFPSIASRFLFEAELALSTRVGTMIEMNNGGVIDARAALVANRYLQAIGRSDIRVNATREERPPGSKPIFHGAAIRPGDRVWHADYGQGVVEAQVYGPVYRVRTERAGEVSVQVAGADWWHVA